MSIKNKAVENYKILNIMGFDYLLSLFLKSNVPYRLRDDNKLVQPLKQTTTFGINLLVILAHIYETGYHTM